MGFYIGIDLGTTYSVVAYVDELKRVQIIQTTPNSVTTPSVVYISESGEVLIGNEAKEEQKAKSMVASFYKRNIGQDTASYYLEDGNAYSSADLSSIFLKELIGRTEAKMNRKVDGAVITVPAYFTEHEKTNTRRAAEKAGINVLHMVNEPTAAAIAYGVDKQYNKKILVYDLGGGTFDVSVAQIDNKQIKIIATIGEHQLGGKNWDTEICNWVAKKFAEQYGDDFSYDAEKMDALMVDAEQLKRNLTSKEKADIIVKYEGNTGKYTLTENEFRNMTRHILERTGLLINQMFNENGMSWTDIDDVILIGGSTRMKMVEDYIVELRGKPALRGINPDEAVALGAALLADEIGNNISQFQLGSADIGFVLVVGDKKIEDVNSHSLGFITSREEVIGEKTYRVFHNEIMIKKNTSLEQATVTKNFTVNSDTLDIYLTQWESSDLPDSEAIIGKYQVANITPNTLFSVTFAHKPDGTVNIFAKQSDKEMTAVKIANHVDRLFEPELIKKPANGAIMIAVDLSGSMSALCTEDKDFKNFMDRLKDDNIQLTSEEFEQLSLMKEYLQLIDENTYNENYRKGEKIASDVWFTAIGMTKKHLRNFVEQFPLDHVSIGIVGFADRIKEFCPITNNEYIIKDAINDLAITIETGEMTKAQPMDYMFEALQKKKTEKNLDFAYAVVLTDGYWDSDATPNALKARAKYINEDIGIIVQGFGDAKENFIKELATLQDLSGIGDVSDLGSNLSNIAQALPFSLTNKSN